MKNSITVSIPVSPETREVEISLPCYRKSKDGTKFVKAIAENDSIIVNAHGNQFVIGHWNFSGCAEHGLRSTSLVDCTPEEFENAYQNVLEKLVSLQRVNANPATL